MKSETGVPLPSMQTDTTQWRKCYDYYRYRSDPLADQVVERFHQMPPGVGQELLNRVLEQGIEAVQEAPEELKELFAQVEHIPEFVDWKRIELGAYTFLRCRMGAVALGCAALPLVYSLPSLNKVLISSGRLVHTPAVRLKETIRFVLTTCQPGGIRRDGVGFRLTVRVRLIHAQVRRMLWTSGEWDRAAWGEPINQWHLAVTNVIFSEVVLNSLRRMGYLFRRNESEALVHLWRYSGYLFGIEPALLCDTEARARALREAAFTLEETPDSHSRELVHGIIEATRATTRRGGPNLIYGISRSLIGSRLAAALDYPQTGWRWLVPAFRPAATLIELAREANVPGVRALARICGTQMLNLLMSERGLPGEIGDFALPQRLEGLHRKAKGDGR